ncbi:hypothetical protein GCM10023205_53120 [Yinghuangia aomiensis]|uniref:Helix-turn-helix domain-containing protein n=1 Tax=Yinghuangia aomiensis TaxID=676205 RepID=A0ABP9HTQ6_9ACTN
MSIVATVSAVELPKRQPAFAEPSVGVRTQRVRVPWRLVESALLPDVALSVYVKVAALGVRPEGCEARTETIAKYLGLSRASVERGLLVLSRQGADGVTELVTVRRTHAGGRGASAVRRVRPVCAGERFVWVPVAAAEDLTPRQLRAYAALAYAVRMQIPLTVGELAGYLRHHSGRRAGLAVTADAAGRVVDEVEAAGWVTVRRRCGLNGRHQFAVHNVANQVPPAESAGRVAAYEAPTLAAEGLQERPAEDPCKPVGQVSSAPDRSCVGEGSGSGVGEGSLAYKESPRTDSPEDVPPLFPPAVGETQVVGGGSSARAGERQAPHACGSSDGSGALRAEGNPTPVRARTGNRSGSSRHGHTGGPAFGREVFAVLEPVRGLLNRVHSHFVLRKIGRAVAEQLDDGVEPARLRHRLLTRFGAVAPSEIRDPGRWLLGVALPRWGCGLWDCETGVMWSTGRPCEVCADVVAGRAAKRFQSSLPDYAPGSAPESPAKPASHDHRRFVVHGDRLGSPDRLSALPDGLPRGTCGDCGARIFLVGPAVGDMLCRVCRAEHDDTLQVQRSAVPAVPQSRRTMAWDCHLAELACRPLADDADSARRPLHVKANATSGTFPTVPLSPSDSGGGASGGMRVRTRTPSPMWDDFASVPQSTARRVKSPDAQ